MSASPLLRSPKACSHPQAKAGLCQAGDAHRARLTWPVPGPSAKRWLFNAAACLTELRGHPALETLPQPLAGKLTVRRGGGLTSRGAFWRGFSKA